MMCSSGSQCVLRVQCRSAFSLRAVYGFFGLRDSVTWQGVMSTVHCAARRPAVPNGEIGNTASLVLPAHAPRCNVET